MTERALVFPCGSDELVGIVHAANGTARNYGVLIVVGGPQYRVGSHRQFVLMARSLADAGYAVFRFDYRGMGDSSGAQRNFDAVDDDIRAAVDAFLAQQPALRGVIIFGLCDAASAALLYCRSDSRLRGLILANPWVRTDAGSARTLVRHYYGRRLLQRSFWTKLFGGQFRPLASIREFVTSLRSARSAGADDVSAPPFVQRMLQGLAGFKRPVLLLLSERDLTAREFEDRCRTDPQWTRAVVAANVQQHAVRNADHTFSSDAALNDVCSRAIVWLRTLD
jgi:exosortase A-associated hydrolase 1